VQDGCTHVYYIYPIVLDVKTLRVSREKIHMALEAEGITGLAVGYQNLHLLPMYQQKMAYGSSGFPWNSDICRREVHYHKGICPVAESLHESSFLGLAMCMYEFSNSEVDAVINAFRKVWGSLDSLG